MSQSTFLSVATFLGLFPVSAYCVFFDKRDDYLRKHPFGVWYFLCEFSILFIVAFVPANLLIVLFYDPSRPIRARIYFHMCLSVMVYFGFLFTVWLKEWIFCYRTRLRDLKPFIREIRGKNPYPDSDDHETKNAKPKWQFTGCGLSIVIIFVTHLIYLWLWVTA